MQLFFQSELIEDELTWYNSNMTTILRPQDVGKVTGELGKKLLIVLLEMGEGFLDGLYNAVAHPNMNFSKYTGNYHSVYRSARRLEKRGYIRSEKRGGKTFVILTKTGYQYAEMISVLSIKIERPKKWDRRWRVVIFDIPEEHKIVREVLRDKLKQLGFTQLQESVFILPWPCKEVIEKIQKVYLADRFIRYLEVTSFDGEDEFRRIFNIA